MPWKDDTRPCPPLDSRPIRILVADDDPGLRSRLASAFEQEAGLQVVGQASDGQQAVQLARKLHPDVVIMDGFMPKLDGAEATRQIMADSPQVRVIGLSRFPCEQWVSAMTAAGATAALAKKGCLSELLALVRGR
jgi:DNA-binding NarL/FixJ family response regulator